MYKKSISSYKDKLLTSILIESYNSLFESNYVEEHKNKLSDDVKSYVFNTPLEFKLATYLQSTNQDTFLINENNALDIIHYIWPYTTRYNELNAALKDRLEYLTEYNGKTINELIQSAKESQHEYINYINDEVSDRVLAHKKAELIITSQSQLKVEPLNIATTIKSIVNSDAETKDHNNVIVYVYGKNLDDSIGLVVNVSTKKIEMFDENEEADDTTQDMVTALLVDPESYVTVYCAHDVKLCEHIFNTNEIPANLFFSPKKQYAESYLDKSRDIISFNIQYKYIRQHSNVDWKSKEKCKVDKVKYI